MIHIPVFINLNGNNKKFGGFPNECPECHRSISAVVRYAFAKEGMAYVMFSCPANECGVRFAYEFSYDHASTMYDYNRHVIGNIKTREFPRLIQEISPNFCKIYKEAESAEQHQLLEVCGVAYRKALEFLIKDYLISLAPENEISIKVKFLGKCISDDIENERIKTVAKRATWLGNDETHYVRKWESKDLKDLKSLINLVVLWIEMELATKEIINEMPEA